MSDKLTPTRLRALIAAARPNASYCAYCGQPDGNAAQALADYLDGNASALADALAKVKIYEDALIAISQGRSGCEQVYCADVADEALGRAAKEAAEQSS